MINSFIIFMKKSEKCSFILYFTSSERIQLKIQVVEVFNLLFQYYNTTSKIFFVLKEKKFNDLYVGCSHSILK